MDIRQVEMFLVVSEELHFGRASTRLHLSQPSLSQSIRRLERSLGVKLFERTTRQVTLTDAGAIYADRITTALDDLRRARDAARDAAAGRAGTLRLGFTTINPYDFLPRLAAVHRDRFPGVGIQPELVSNHVQVDRIIDSSLDAGLLWLPLGATSTAPEQLQCTTISEHRLVLAAPASHPVAATDQLRLADLRGLPFVGFHMRAGGSVLTEAAVAACRQADVIPTIVQDAPDVRTLLALVGAGVGVGIFPDAIRILDVPSVRILEIEDDLPSIRFSFAHRRSNESALVRELAESVERLGAQL